MCLLKFENKPDLVLVGQSVTLGRDPSCDFVIANRQISRHHALFFVTESGWAVRSLGANGTFVNGDRITEVTRLEHGDRLQLAKDLFADFCCKDLTDGTWPVGESIAEAGAIDARLACNDLRDAETAQKLYQLELDFRKSATAIFWSIAIVFVFAFGAIVAEKTETESLADSLVGALKSPAGIAALMGSIISASTAYGAAPKNGEPTPKRL